MILEKWDEEAKEVVKGFSNKEKERLDAIIAMHIMVCNIDDEGTTENALFNEAVELFKKLWKNYAAEKNGLYIGGKLY